MNQSLEPAVSEIIDALQGRHECPVAAEITRKTRCTCLAQLMRSHRSELVAALEQFFIGIAERTTLVSQANFADRHVFSTVSSGSSQPRLLNAPTNADYILQVPNHGCVQAIILCRSAMMQLTRIKLGSNWDSSESVYPPITIIGRKKKKRALFQILHYLLDRNFQHKRNTSWRHASFLQLGIPKNTAQDYHTKYSLRRIASDLVYRVDKHTAWLRNEFDGRVVILDSYVKDRALPIIAQRGLVFSGYKYVDAQSVGRDSSLKPKRVQFRRIDPLFSKDEKAFDALKRFEEPVAMVLSVDRKNVQLAGSYLKSIGYAPQEPHQDFKGSVLTQYRNSLYLGLTPLSESGSYLQVWPPKRPGMPGFILYIPYGVLLILPGHTVHGGGFLSDYQTLDLRLHFYIYIKPALELPNTNIYLPVEQYPMNKELDNNGLLDRLFQADQR